MGMRSIIEINHDHLYKIQEQPELFMDCLDALLRGETSSVDELETYFHVKRLSLHHSTTKNTKHLHVAISDLKKSFDKLWQAVQDGVYGSRSLLGDELLNMKDVFDALDIK